MPNNKEYFEDLRLIEEVNKSIVDKEREKQHHKTSPGKKVQLEKDLKKLYEQRENLKQKMREHHAKDRK